MTQRLPDFVIIGAQKAGTTWLAHRLLEQPSVFLPRPFEVHYFDRSDNHSKGVDWYASHFADAPRDSLAGEKTPDYLWTRRNGRLSTGNIPERMHDCLPDARLLVVLRDPVGRAISALNHAIGARRLSPFVDADTVLTDALDPEKPGIGLVDRGHYLTDLKRFLEFYPRERIHVIFFEDHIVKAPQDSLDRVMDFLGRGRAEPIRPRPRPENTGMNSKLGRVMNYYFPFMSPLVAAIDRALPRSQGVAPSAECRARLYEHFRPHNEALFNFLGARTEAWNGP